ncbi:MAG: PAS domain S-box protein, partial [Anaerolineae bacterium]
MGRNVEGELRVRVKQQAVVAGLGQRALAGIDLAALMDEAVERVAETLLVEYCKVLELLPDGEALLLRAGVGWQAGLVGQATVSAGLESQAGYTLVSHEPVIVEDLSTETRFSGPPLLHDHGVVSGISVIIQGEGRPFGVMGAHTTSRRTFTQDDVHFLQAAANVLAAAIQRRRAEEVLRESEARFRVLTEHALAGIYLIQDDRFRHVNPALAAMFGYTPEELIGRLGPLDLTAPEDRERVAENIRRRIAGETESIHYTFRGLRKDGTLFECEALGSVAAYDGRPVVLGMLLDITERRRAEVALRESEEKYRSLFEHANDSIFIIDPATQRFLDVNENAARRLGYTREELLQLAFDDIDTPMAAARNEAIIRELQEAGSVVFEHAHRRKDGAEMPVEISSRVIEYGGRQVFQSFARDITDRKLAEAKQAHFQSLLRAMSDVNQLIVRASDPQAMLQEACQILQSTRGYAGLWIGLLDEAGQRLRQVAGAGIVTDVEPVDVSLDEPGPPLYCARTALNERRPYLVKDVGESHPCATCSYRAQSAHAGALAVPLLHRQGCYGALVVYTERPWAFHEDETELLSELANDLALGLYSLEAEERLRQSEERFRNAFERAAIGRGIAAPDGRFLQANQSFCDIVGYPMDEFLQKKWQDITHPADLEASARHVGQLMAGEVPSFRFEHRLVHRDGHAVWVDLNVVLVRDLEGNPLYMVGDIVDLTERKKLQEALASERDEFNFILQELPVGVTVLDSEDKYVYINPASLKIDGYKNDRDSLVGQDVRGNHPPHTLATVEQLLHDFKAGERSVFSREARRGRRTVEITYHALRDLEGEYQGLVRLVSDITERRQAAEALRASEEKYRLLIETANEAIVVAQDGMLKFFNPKAMEITGYSQAELASKPFPELIHPDDRQMVVENHLKRLAGETLPQTYPFRIVDKSGNTKWMEINAVVIDWEGRPATLSLLTDITERKRAE